MITEKIVNKIGQSNNSVITNGITVLIPRIFFNLFYAQVKKESINWHGKKTCFTISFDIDFPRDVTALSAVIDILDSYSIKGSFACVGRWIKQYPKEHKKIVANGHEIINHTFTHPYLWSNNTEYAQVEDYTKKRFKDLTYQEKIEELETCHTICKEVLDYEPIGFRIPHFGSMYTKEIYPILMKWGYEYSSSIAAVKTPKFGLPYFEEEVLEFPLTACPKHPFGVFDSWHAFNSKHASHKNDFFQTFQMIVEKGIETGMYLNFYFDPYDYKKMELHDLLEFITANKNLILTRNYKELVTDINDKKVSGIPQ
jgi:hypothetical protein